VPRRTLFAELGDTVREPRHFSLCGIAMNDAVVRRPDQRRLGFGHGGQRRGAIASRDRLFDLTHRRAHARAPPRVDRSAAGGLARGFLGGFRIGHKGQTQTVVNEKRGL
jgi:hypothetical protein